MLKIAIVDDDIKEREKLSSFIEQYLKDKNLKERHEINISSFLSGDQFLNETTINDFSIVFLDIDMPGLNGIQTAEKIRETNQTAALIFVTNIAQYAIEGYKVHALDYVLKPLSYDDFILKFDRTLRYIKKYADKNLILSTTNSSIVNVLCSEIEYIEVLNHYLTYHTKKGNFTCRGTISEVEIQLEDYSFFRISKSFLINLNYVTSFKGREIQLETTTLLLSMQKKEEFNKRLCDFFGGSDAI